MNKLTALQMADFVANGYLLLENVVPEDINRQVLADEERLSFAGYEFWEQSEAVRAAFNSPKMKAAIDSLVGTDAYHDHSFLHVVGPQYHKSQHWHVDSALDIRPFGFDIQIFYFAHDTPVEMGPTLVLPGSHLRKVNGSAIARYKNISGQRKMAAKAGSVAIFHHGLWHCAQPNYTDKTRYVFKLRLHPTVEQVGLFDLTGYDSPEVFDLFHNTRTKSAGEKQNEARLGQQISVEPQKWVGSEQHLENIKRAKFWRYVTGDPKIDVSVESVLNRMGI